MRVSFLLTIAFAISLSSCDMLKVQRLKKVGDFSTKTFDQSIPFEYSNNIIFIKVQINEKDYNFMFDTGAEVGAISPDILTEIDYNGQSSVKVHDSNKAKARLHSMTIDYISIGDVDFKNMWAISQDMSALENHFACDIPLHGILGSNVMRKANWKIDYQNKVIHFRNLGDDFPISQNSQTITMDCRKFGSAYIPLTIDGTKASCTYDTGYNGFITTKRKSKEGQNQSKRVEWESFTIGFHGATRQPQISHAAIDVRMDNIQLGNQILRINNNAPELIGNKFWSHYDVIIDWQHCQLHLDQKEEHEAKPLRVFQYGFAKNIKEKKIYISTHFPTHRFYQPIAIDNEVITLDGHTIADLPDLCGFVNNKLMDILEKEEFEMSIKENGKKKYIMMKKETLLKI